jgi:hypothetical protein
LRKGASVRAAAAIVSIAQSLDGAGDGLDSRALRAAALAALATRVELRDEEGIDPHDALGAVVDEIIETVKKN